MASAPAFADYSVMTADEVRAALVGALNATGANATEISRNLGRADGYISDFLRKKKDRLDGEAAAYLETALELPQGSLVVTARRGAREATAAVRPKQADGTARADIPVYAATEGGSGEMMISSDPIERVARPWYFKGVTDGYAVLVVGESMEPRYAPGEIVTVNPKAALVRGKDCIVTTAREGGDFRAMLKTYAGSTEDSWKLRQFNPAKEFSLKKREWPFCLRVVGRYDGG